MTDSDYSAIVNEFDQLVRKHFAYLEEDYGFSAGPVRKKNLNEPRDASASIRYRGQAVSVQVGISLIGDGIAVTFKDENWLASAKRQRARWTSLDSVIQFRCGDALKSLLHEFTSSRHKFWPRNFLLENMDSVIAVLAARIREHASDILRGDVSSFPEIAEFERKNPQ